MRVLSGLEPEKVFYYFEEICSIPHGSGNVEQISNYLVDFARKRKLRYRQDEMFNVIIWKDGSAGYEDSEPLIIEGHMDMVAVKTANCAKDMEKEGLDLEVHGDMVSATGTSLGGDDGIAVAYGLAILDDDEMAHPPLEAVFTVDEEIGMLGADYLDASDLRGHRLLNLDSEDEGIFTVSCAGGVRVTSRFLCQMQQANRATLTIHIDDFRGGHSGVEIDKGRANANIVMGRLLYSVMDEISLIRINGGEKDNAIAMSCEAVTAVPSHKLDTVKQTVLDTFHTVAAEYETTEPEPSITITIGKEEEQEFFSAEDTKRVVRALFHMPDGVQKMNADIQGLVQTSLNLGILRTNKECVEIIRSVRSSVESEKMLLIEKIRDLTELFGGSVELFADYPGWAYRADSKIRDVMIEVYRKLYAEDPVVEGVHAGLECGLFASKIDDLDAISVGPQMYDIHTVNEMLSISSVKRTWELITETLTALK
ncbi:MAG: aminoacyl-histidine dipeptidase [Clostridiales bacterium]|nr:aminoacyl-histidine dipeptidase [Clostridiales bacterium]